MELVFDGQYAILSEADGYGQILLSREDLKQWIEQEEADKTD